MSDNELGARENGHITATMRHYGDLADAQNVETGGNTKTGKTTMSPERLIAYSSYDFYLPDTILYALGKTDTANFVYSNMRGSEFNFNTMTYDVPTDYYDVAYPAANLFSGSHVTFTGPMYHPGILCDSAQIWSSTAVDTTGKHYFVFANTDNIVETYDTSNNIIEHYDQSLSHGKSITGEYLNTFDISGRCTGSVSLTQEASLPAFDTNKSMVHFYNISGKLAMDSVSTYVGGGVWVPLEKWNYNYDVLGNPIKAMYFTYNGSAWQEQQEYLITYNPDNTIKSDSETAYVGSAWLTVAYNTYGYTAGVKYCTSYENDNYVNGVLNTRTTVTKHVAVSGFPDTVYTSQYNLSSGKAPSYLVSASRAIFVYDFYNNPVLAYQYYYNITDSATGAGSYDKDLDKITFYYYENYSKEAAVKSVPATPESIKVYPNPFSGDLNIYRPGIAKGSYTTLKLINMLGETVKSSQMPWLNEMETWSLSDVSAGTYLLRIEDLQGNNLSTQKIVKQ